MICISKGKIKNLTIDKNYIITRRQDGVHSGSNKPLTGLWVINDANIERHYSSKRFIDVSEWRDKQLTVILEI